MKKNYISPAIKDVQITTKHVTMLTLSSDTTGTMDAKENVLTDDYDDEDLYKIFLGWDF